MKKTRATTIKDKIKEIKNRIISNSKDAEWANKMLLELVSLQKQEDVEPVELIVPTKEVRETLDFGAVKIMRTIRGYLVQCKGGMATFVELRMSAVCAMINTLFELHGKERNEEDENIYEAFREAVLYIFQAPIFASLSDELLFGIATDILRRFKEYSEPKQEIPHEETEEDIKENIEVENTAKAIEQMVNVQIPADIP